MRNECHLIDCLKYMAGCRNGEFNFIFIDPPYFRVKGEFDFKLTFSEWIELHKNLAKECYRILKDNGSLILWGHAKKIAYQQIEFDKYFNLLNSCVWEKTNGQGRRSGIEKQRSFLPVTERFLFYDKGEDKSGLTMIYSNPDLFKSIKNYMRNEKEKIKKDFGFTTEKEFNEFINKITDTKSVVSRHYFADSQYVFPTKEIYLKLQKIKNNKYFRKEYEDLKKEYKYFKKEYEDLRREYENLRRYFRLNKIKYDVIKWIQEDNKTRENDHPTCKPPGLVAELIRTCCGPDSKIFEPFTGTETLRKICYNMGFDYQGCENNPDYWQAQESRYQNYIAQGNLFQTDDIQDLIYQEVDIL